MGFLREYSVNMYFSFKKRKKEFYFLLYNSRMLIWVVYMHNNIFKTIDQSTNRKVKTIRTIILVAIASLIMSINIKTFVHSGGLLPGGITGLSLLVQRIFLRFFNLTLPYSLINIILNAIPAIIGFKMISKRFTFYSVVMIVLNSLLVDVIPAYTITSDPLLVALFGGLLNGIAIVIALYGNASSGGTDFIAVYLNRRFNISSWNIILLFNSAILLTSGMLFGFKASLYSIIFQFVSTQTISTFHKSNQKVTMLIITNYADAIEDDILNTTHHGITKFMGEGVYDKAPRCMLYTVVSADEVNLVADIVHMHDPHAFINVLRSTSVKGKFYQKPLD